MDTQRCIKERKTTRFFKEDPVPREALEKIIEAGKDAPSALNVQPWHFYVIEGEPREKMAGVLKKCTLYLEDIITLYSQMIVEEEKKKETREKFRYELAEFFVELGKAPVLIAVVMPEEKNETVRKAALLANGCAIQNMQLAAWEMGIGAVCLTCCSWVEEEVKKVLDLDTGEIITVLALGFPEGHFLETGRNNDNVSWLS